MEITKTREIAQLMKSIATDLKDKKLSSKGRLAILEKLKIYGRRVQGSEAIYCADGITTLANVAVNEKDKSCFQEALRVLANALFLEASMRQALIESGYLEKFSLMYESESKDDEFLLARILFFSTYAATKDKVEFLVDQYKLADNVANALKRTSTQLAMQPHAPDTSPMFAMALSETTKLLFGIKSKLFDREDLFTSEASTLFDILTNFPRLEDPLSSPAKDVISAISGLELENIMVSCLEGNKDIHSKLQKFLNHWTSAVVGKDDTDLFEESGAPLIKVVLDVARFGTPAVRSQMQERLLPSEAERDKPLGRGDTLAARLLKITASPAAPHTRNLISALLFELSDNDAATFVRNVGYGNASGYLMQQGLAAPEESMKASSSGDADEAINPITGQKLSAEKYDDLPEMTDEEKEREAERLFVLFERLKKTGVIDVQNPVEKAMQEGRFEEID